jgi:hypothetical protein
MRVVPRVLLPIVLLATAAGLAAPATAQPAPPNRFFGTARLNGTTPPAGTPVTAYINNQLCGTGQVRDDGRYVVDVVDAAQMAGCGTPGATITFQIGGVQTGQTGTYQRGFFTELNLTAPATARAPFVESSLFLGDPRPCIPEQGQTACDATRLALWNGEADAWAARGVTDPDARFNETVVFRVEAGDPGAIRNIARILGWPYLKITDLRFGGNEFIEITNLGGGDQDMTGWIVQAIDRGKVVSFPDGFVMAAGQSCRIYSGVTAADSCGNASFDTTDVWPDDAGTAVLFYAALALPGDQTRYSADPNNQPPPPNLQGVQ